MSQFALKTKLPNYLRKEQERITKIAVAGGDGDLLFSCTLPNLIVGTVGNGKDLPGVDAALERLGCRGLEESGAGARRLAGLIAATVLCGELSLLAAQTNPGELMQSHVLMERRAGGRA